MGKFVYQIERKEEEKYQKIITYGVDEKNRTKIDKITHPYILYVKKDQFEALNINSDNIILADQNFCDKEGEKVIKLEIKNKELYEYLIKNLKDMEYQVYEEDIPFEHQLIIEEKLKLSDKDSKNVKFNTLSVDIETIGDVQDQKIVLISSYKEEKSKYNKVYVAFDYIDEKKKETIENAKFSGFEIVKCENEKELLEKFKKDVIECSPQIILGWNVIDFDFAVIRKRMQYYDIEFNLSPFEGDTKMRIAKDFFGKSSLNFPGIIVFDAIQLLKTNFISFEDFKLNTVAKEVLEDEKIDLEDGGEADNGIENKISAIEDMLRYDPVNLIEYNFKDSLLTKKIVDKLSLLDLMVERSLITSTPLMKVQSPIASLDIMYLRELKKKKKVANSHYNFTQGSSPIEGAYVMTPKPNFYEDVFVLDFKSLYPSVIMTFNIDPFTYDKKGQIESPNGAKFLRERGILPGLIEEIFKEREKAKKSSDSVKAAALKVTMNSFYGAMASPKSRFYNKDIGEAITSFGRKIIQTSKKVIEEEHYGEVVYGDTDSVFVYVPGRFNSFEDKKIYGDKIQNRLNEYFREWCYNEFGVESRLTIELEKIFSKFFIASKKRYVGYDEFTKKTSFTGLEAVRGDWTELARNFQVKLVNLLFNNATKEEIKEFFRDECNKLKNGDYDDLIVYKKKLSKPLEEYTKTTPPHVKAARELPNFSGKNVEYVMTKDGPRHISLLGKKDEIDYEHYIDKQIKGVSDDFLKILELDFDEVIGKKKKQKSLDSFF